jgi:chaperonin cofactor prefoldin
MELRAEVDALKEMETRKDFLELQVRRLTESISAIDSLLGNDPNS